MKNLLLPILLFVSIYNAYSQQSYCPCSADDDYGVRLQTGLIGYEYYNPVKGYEGDQYFNNWSFGAVLMSSGDIIKNISLRYDKYTDELLWMRQSDFKIGVIPKSAITGFWISAYQNRREYIASFIKMNIVLPMTGPTDVYLEVLVSGDVSLYVYRNVNIISTTAYSLNDNTRYILSSAGQQYRVTLSRRNLLAIPTIQKTEMKTILRSNRINVNDSETELIRAIALYNADHKQQTTP